MRDAEKRVVKESESAAHRSVAIDGPEQIALRLDGRCRILLEREALVSARIEGQLSGDAKVMRQIVADCNLAAVGVKRGKLITTIL